MSIFRALHTLNAIEAGAMDSAALEALLADPGRYAEWQSLANMQGQAERMWASNLTLDTILGSGRALRAMATTRSKQFYSPEYLKFLAPSAWAAYLPDSNLITTVATGGVSAWKNALGDSAKDAVMATAAQQPLLSYSQSPLYAQPVVDFISSDYLATAVSMGATSLPYTVFVVYKRSGATANGFFASVGNPGFGSSAAGAATSFNSALGTFNNAVAASGQWGLSRFRRSALTSLFHSLDGGEESAAITTATMIPELAGGANIGRGTNNTMTGQIAEVWIVLNNGDAASVEIQRITTMLKNKYGL